MRPTLKVLALALAVPLTACHSVSSAEIVPRDVEIERALGGSVRILATGSGKQALIGPSVIDAGGLADAVSEAVLACGLFDEVALEGQADRVLEVEVVELVEPEVGFDSHCSTTLRWSLRSGDGSRVLHTATITTEATMNSYEEMDSTVRPQLVMEKALRENITRGLRSLSSAAR